MEEINEIIFFKEKAYNKKNKNYQIVVIFYIFVVLVLYI